MQQPGLPSGDDLHALYREMHDDAYLREEAGRRATARRLLGLIGRHVPAGRLLDVGCGHGLLLDEARRLGYDVAGLELSRAAARLRARRARARRRRGSRSRRPPTRDARFDVDRARRRDRAPRRSRRRARRAARRCSPTAACCAWSRPTPRRRRRASPATRWWGLVPAHTCLLPRRTLRELLSRARAGDLRRRPARALVRAALLARRPVRARRPRRPRAAGGSGRTRLGGRTRLAVARRRAGRARPPGAGRAPRRAAARAAARPAARVTVVLPAYRAADTIPAVAARDARSTPSTGRCWSTTRARTRRPPWRCARASTSCAIPSTAATAATRRRATCARCSTAPRSSSWCTPTTSTTRRSSSAWSSRSRPGSRTS